jgi:hypothetical protein
VRSAARAGLVCLLLIVLAVGWFAVASDYGDSVAVGTYHLRQGGESSNLILKADHTFQQDVTHDGATQRCEGKWRRIGEGGLAFSKQFLPVVGQELGADGTPYGQIEKTFGLFPSITLAQYHVLWYGRTDPSPTSLIAGTYAGDEEGVPATLVMKNDDTFDQEVTHAGLARHAHGTWSVRENGDILFSRDFLKTSGESLTGDEIASAWDPKGSNLQIQVAANPSLAQPVFRKRMLGH